MTDPFGLSQAEVNIRSGADLRAQQLHDMSMATDAVHLEAARLQLEQQKQEIAQMAKLMGGNGGSPITVEDQAQLLANAGYAALARGESEKGKQMFTAAQDLRDKDATMQKTKGDIFIQNANRISSLLQGVTPQTWPEVQKSLPPQYRGPWDPAKIQQLQTGIMSAAERTRADLEKLQAKEAQNKLDNSNLDRDYRKAQLDAERELANARRKAGSKPPSGYEWDTTKDIPTLKVIPGGKEDVKEKEKVAQEGATLKIATQQIDDLLGLLDKHSAVTGGAGLVRRGGEWVLSSLGKEDIPATDVADKMAFIQSQVPQWLELGKRSGADQRKLLVDAVSGLQTMTSKVQAVKKLTNLKKVLKTIYSTKMDSQSLDDKSNVVNWDDLK